MKGPHKDSITLCACVCLLIIIIDNAWSKNLKKKKKKEQKSVKDRMKIKGGWSLNELMLYNTNIKTKWHLFSLTVYDAISFNNIFMTSLYDK